MIQDKIENNAEKLGFKKLDSAEIIAELNTVIATYQVFFHKLQNFHWNVVGGEFFDIHDLTEEMYTAALKDIDELAERVRVFGQVPIYKMKDYLEKSIIKESQSDLSAEYMAKQIIGDLQALIETIIGLHEAASKNGDIGDVHLAGELIKRMEKNHWKLNAWCDSRFKVS